MLATVEASKLTIKWALPFRPTLASHSLFKNRKRHPTVKYICETQCHKYVIQKSYSSELWWELQAAAALGNNHLTYKEYILRGQFTRIYFPNKNKFQSEVFTVLWMHYKLRPIQVPPKYAFPFGDENAWHVHWEAKGVEMRGSDYQWFDLRWKTWHAGL